MSGPRKIPAAEWETYKARLHALFIKADKPLGQVIEHVACEYCFRPSKAQYIRQFKKWGFEKNAKSEIWKSITREVRKRKAQGKDSEISIKDRRISDQKLRKEMSRYALPSGDAEYSSPGFERLDDVVVRTPKGEDLQVIEYLHIPWLEFQTLVEPCFEYIRQLNSKDMVSHDLSHQPELNGGLGVQFNIPGHLSENQLGPWNVEDLWVQPQAPGSLCDQYLEGCGQNLAFSVYPGQEGPIGPVPEEFIREAVSLLAECVSSSSGVDVADDREKIYAHLENLTIEMHDGQLAKSAKRLNGPSKLEPIFQLVSYSVYLSSNNLLPYNKTIELVEWMNKSGTQWLLPMLMDLKTPTTEIFGSNILVSAARLGYIDTVRSLLAKGVEVNALAGEYIRVTALQQAVKRDHFPVVQLLLDAGANPKLHIGTKRSIIGDALYGESSLEIMQMLLDKGAFVNDVIEDDIFENITTTGLAVAAAMPDLAMTRLLLKAGARVNEVQKGCTALQAAAESEDVDVVQLLIDAGANLDAPVGEFFAEARQAAVEDGYYERLTTPIQRASLADNTELVQILLHEGADVNASPWQDYTHYIRREMYLDLSEKPILSESVMTALQAAALNENSVLVRALLSADADVDARGCGNTALQIAAAMGDDRVVQILLRHGADVDAPADEYYGSTALQTAAETNDYELVQQLLNAGADVNAPPSPTGGRTALQAAAGNGNIDIAQILLAAGANINAEASPREGRTCLQTAVEECHAEMVFLLLNKGADVNSPASITSGGLTALQAALMLYCGCSERITTSMEKSRTAILQAVLKTEVDVNAAPSPQKGTSTLAAAVRSGSSALVRTLLQRGLDPNGHPTSDSAFGPALAQESAELVSLLIHARADVNAYYTIYRGLNDVHAGVDARWTCCRNFPCDEMTALQEAAYKGNVSIAKILLGAGAKTGVLSQRPHAKTALQCAVEGNCTPIVQLLIASGADPNQCETASKGYYTALGTALSRLSINIDILVALIDAGADVNKIASPHSSTPLLLAARKGNVEAVRLLLKAGARIGATCETESTVLQAAVGTRNIDLIQILLNAGANINDPAGADSGRTALQRAVENSDTAMVEYLLSQGADVNAPAGYKRGITALQGAMIGGHLKIVLLLLKAGAQINAPPAKIEGRMALEAAAEHGRLDIVLLLLKNDDDAEAIEVRCKRAAKLAALNGHNVIARILREHKTSRSSTI